MVVFVVFVVFVGGVVVVFVVFVAGGVVEFVVFVVLVGVGVAGGPAGYVSKGCTIMLPVSLT